MCCSADPSEPFLPDITSDTSDSKPLLLQTTASTAHVDSTPVPAAKKLRRSSTKDSSTTTAHTASVTHRPPLAIRPAPSSFPMMSQPVMGMGGGQWGGYQNMTGYVWGTPMAGGSMDSSSSWQVCILTHLSEQLCQSVSCTCEKCLWASHTDPTWQEEGALLLHKSVIFCWP